MHSYVRPIATLIESGNHTKIAKEHITLCLSLLSELKTYGM